MTRPPTFASLAGSPDFAPVKPVLTPGRVADPTLLLAFRAVVLVRGVLVVRAAVLPAFGPLGGVLRAAAELVATDGRVVEFETVEAEEPGLAGPPTDFDAAGAELDAAVVEVRDLLAAAPVELEPVTVGLEVEATDDRASGLAGLGPPAAAPGCARLAARRLVPGPTPLVLVAVAAPCVLLGRPDMREAAAVLVDATGRPVALIRVLLLAVVPETLLLNGALAVVVVVVDGWAGLELKGARAVEGMLGRPAVVSGLLPAVVAAAVVLEGNEVVAGTVPCFAARGDFTGSGE